MAAEIEGGASMKSSEETKENNEDAIEESASDGVQHYTEHDSNAAPISVSTNSIVGGLPPSARPFRALLVDFTLAADDAQCVIALHWLEQHLLGLDRTQVSFFFLLLPLNVFPPHFPSPLPTPAPSQSQLQSFPPFKQ
jgi:hypothetical protein